MSYSGAMTARAARENLGRSLAALQEDPNIPPDVLAVAQNLAQAVGKLFEAERATSEAEGKAAVKAAMGLVGQTLALLQDVREQHRGIQMATETLAGSMSQLYPLTTAPSIRPGPSPVNAPLVGIAAPAPVPGASAASVISSQATQAFHPQPSVAQQPYAQPQPAQAFGPTQAQPAFTPPAAPGSSPFASPAALAQPPAAGVDASGLAFQKTAPSQPAVQMPHGRASSTGGLAGPATSPAAAGYRDQQHREAIEVNIGATTESNFFVGFSGEVSEGGVFAATYNIHPRGTPMRVHITLPGGFDRVVDGVVKFVRDPMDLSAEDAVPGMGIAFERLDPEGRELILRFIRKRPPMFYDE